MLRILNDKFPLKCDRPVRPVHPLAVQNLEKLADRLRERGLTVFKLSSLKESDVIDYLELNGYVLEGRLESGLPYVSPLLDFKRCTLRKEEV